MLIREKRKRKKRKTIEKDKKKAQKKKERQEKKKAEEDALFREWSNSRFQAPTGHDHLAQLQEEGKLRKLVSPAALFHFFFGLKFLQMVVDATNKRAEVHIHLFFF